MNIFLYHPNQNTSAFLKRNTEIADCQCSIMSATLGSKLAQVEATNFRNKVSS